MLPGDRAYEIFMSSEPFPLHKLLDDWKSKGTEEAGYILAVIGAYKRMVENCADGRYSKIRKG